MILTDYYKLERLPETKSATRFDCTISTQSYNEFEALRNKHNQLFVYYSVIPDRFKGNSKRLSEMALTKTKSITSVFVPNISLPFAYGDTVNTNDAIIMIFNTEQTIIDLFIARGQKNNKTSLYNLLTEGELDDEIKTLKSRAVTEIVT